MKKSSKNLTYYPVFLRLEQRKCIVVGGGEVAERKVGSLLEAGARVEVISPQFSPGLQQSAQQGLITIKERSFVSSDLQEAFLIITATDDSELNRSIARESRRKNIPVNVVNDPDEGTFIVPSVVRRGDLAVAISTSGRSPTLARRIKEELELYFGQEYTLLVDLVSEIRKEFINQGRKIPPQIGQHCLDHELLDLLRQGNMGAARDKLLAASSNTIDESMTE